MRKIVFFIFVLIALCAFSLPEGDLFPQRVMRRLVNFIGARPAEKVYLHTDRDHYESGDKVWFRAYLTDGSTNKASDLSRFVYVELRDRQDSLFARIKVPFRDSVFAGFLPLPVKLSQGDYFIRAYSYWMQNDGDEYVFRKKIRVLNPRDSKVQVEVAYHKNEKGEFARIRFFNSREEPYDKIFVDCLRDKKLKIARTDENGMMEIKLDSTDFGKKLLVRFKESTPFDYERYIYMPDPRKDFEVSFMPEGGHLLQGCQQMVAFKVIGRDGLSREVKGFVYNDKQEQVAFVQTLHKGMGAFEINAEAGRRYYAEFYTEDSIRKRFDLPVPVSDGIGLNVLASADWLGYSVLGAGNTVAPDSLYILGHAKGVPLFCHSIRIGMKGKFPIKDLPEGILHLLIMDSKGEVYSQRLCFIHRRERPGIVLNPDKSTYYVRDQVHLGIQIEAGPESVKKGSFSVAVTDDGQIERDSLQDHILSSLLLTSDIKGHVEEPAWYFKDDRVITRRMLDLLMMTQGWSRFNVQKVVRQEYDSMKYYMERGQAISGKVKNFWGKNAVEANLILLSTSGIVQIVQADSNGRFMIDGITFPDSTKFVLQGKSKRGRRSVEVMVDEDKYMAPYVQQPFAMNKGPEKDDFYKKFAKDFYYDNGIKVYVLDEAVVQRRTVAKYYSFYDQMADYGLDSAKLASMGTKDIRAVLSELPGVEAWGDSVQRFGKTLHILLNEFEEDLSQILLLQPRDLVSISLILPPKSQVLFGNQGANGVLSITTNPNYIPRDLPRLNMLTFSVLGYQKRAQFYMPHYEVDSVRLALKDTADVRPTIYWNPVVRTDETGKAECFFTTSDRFGPYTVIIEGILEDGTVCRKEEKIRLKSF